MVILRQNGEPKKSRYGGGSITKLPSGSWILKWYGPADQDGPAAADRRRESLGRYWNQQKGQWEHAQPAGQHLTQDQLQRQAYKENMRRLADIHLSHGN